MNKCTFRKVKKLGPIHKTSTRGRVGFKNHAFDTTSSFHHSYLIHLPQKSQARLGWYRLDPLPVSIALLWCVLGSYKIISWASLLCETTPHPICELHVFCEAVTKSHWERKASWQLLRSTSLPLCLGFPVTSPSSLCPYCASHIV